jgi:hypothetical protein
MRTGLVEEDRKVFVRVLEQGESNANFGDGIKGTTCAMG